MEKTMLRIAPLGLALAVGFTSAALAQDAARSERNSADEVAMARAQADAIINKASASDVFENITTTRMPTVRHKLTGMQCDFQPGDASALVTVYSDKPRGENVSCTAKARGLFDTAYLKTTYATRLADAATTEQLLEMSAQALIGAHPDAKLYAKPLFSIGSPGFAHLPQSRRRYYAFKDKDGGTLGVRGAQLISRLAVSSHDGWAYKQTMYALNKDRDGLSMNGEFEMVILLSQVTGTEKAVDAAVTKVMVQPSD